MNHYKWDWHRYNLKRSLLGLAPVTSNQFEDNVAKKEMDGDELSSISGSEEEDVDNEAEVDDDANKSNATV